MNPDEVEIAGVPISGRYVRARKDHVCVSCANTIKAGDIYWRAAWRVGAQLFCEKRCTPCIIAEESL